MFSGGDYDEVRRWLRNFLTSHAKREDPRIEVALDSDGERDGVSYAARLRLGERLGSVSEFDFKEVAERRGTLAWCLDVAARTRARARELLG
ncbi:MAG: hypothetical protein ACREJG_05865 [Candidatus Rokuibacteriota bacterium]